MNSLLVTFPERMRPLVPDVQFPFAFVSENFRPAGMRRSRQFRPASGLQLPSRLRFPLKQCQPGLPP
jgi:hypothetical protein